MSKFLHVGAPCRFSDRFEDANCSLEDKDEGLFQPSLKNEYVCCVELNFLACCRMKIKYCQICKRRRLHFKKMLKTSMLNIEF